MSDSPYLADPYPFKPDMAVGQHAISGQSWRVSAHSPKMWRTGRLTRVERLSNVTLSR